MSKKSEEKEAAAAEAAAAEAAATPPEPVDTRVLVVELIGASPSRVDDIAAILLARIDGKPDPVTAEERAALVEQMAKERRGAA